jgi:N utilization substance protein B
MSRRLAREIALQTLFQLDFSPLDFITALSAVTEEREGKSSEKSIPYASLLGKGVLTCKREIDSLIEEYAKDWNVTRIAGVDINIMRIALYEMFFAEKSVDAGVAINEAVELAKIYSSDEAPRFINGILGNIVKTKNQGA